MKNMQRIKEICMGGVKMEREKMFCLYDAAVYCPIYFYENLFYKNRRKNGMIFYEVKAMGEKLLPEDMELHNNLEDKEKYTPRPRWQLAFAWCLVCLMVMGVFGSYYWIMYRY